MPDRIITAEALITAKDGTGDVFSKIAHKLEGIGKSAKQSVEIDKMTKALERQQSQLRALDKFQAARGKFTDARAAFNAQKVAVEQAAKAMAGAVKPTKEMEAAYKQTQAAVSKASAELTKQKTALMDLKRAAEGFGVPLTKVASDQARLRHAIEGTTAAIEKQAAAEVHAAQTAKQAAAAHHKMEQEQERRAHAREHGIAHHGVVNYALGAAAAAVSAHGIATVGEKALHAGAELQHERVASLNAGRTPEELKEYEEAARRVAAKRPTASYTESMKTALETTSSFGSVEHAIEHLDFMMRTSSVLKAASGGKLSESPGEMGQQFAKFFEMRGVANDPERFEHEGNEMVRAMAFSGGTFNPREMFNFAQQAKAALRTYDLDYMSRVVPSLVGEANGDRAGTGANAFLSVINGKAHDKKQTAKWIKYGLLDPKMVSDKKDSWESGAVKGTDLAMRNPLRWFEEIVLPAMAAKGVDVNNTGALSQALSGMFRNQNSNQFAQENAQLADRNRLHKDAALMDKTAHPEEMYQRNLREDPTVALTALTASLDSLGAAVTSPGMKAAAGVITGISGALMHLAEVAMEHPMAAMTAGGVAGAAALGGAGYMSYQVMNGFGLGASATALDGSATALSGAAAALTEAAAAQGGKQAVGTAAQVGGTAAAVAGGSVLAGLGIATLGAGLVTAPLVLARDPERQLGGRKAVDYNAGDELPGMNEANEREARVPAPPPLPAFYGHHLDTIAPPPTPHPALAPIADQASKAPTFTGLGGGAPSISGPITATVQQPVPVDVTGKVQLEGQGHVSVSVQVIGDGKVVGQAATSSGNIKVSAGTSMPGAASPDKGGDK